MHVTPLDLIRNGETHTLGLIRQSSGICHVLLQLPAHDLLIGTGRIAAMHKRRRTWHVVSEVTGNTYTGATLQEAATQLFYSEADRWKGHEARRPPGATTCSG